MNLYNPHSFNLYPFLNHMDHFPLQFDSFLFIEVLFCRRLMLKNVFTFHTNILYALDLRSLLLITLFSYSHSHKVIDLSFPGCFYHFIIIHDDLSLCEVLCMLTSTRISQQVVTRKVWKIFWSLLTCCCSSASESNII